MLRRSLGMTRSIQKASAQVGFFQDPPCLSPNSFESDPALQALLKRYIPQKQFEEIKGDLSRFGQRCIEEIKPLGDDAETNLPRIEHFDIWGKRVDKLITSEGWKRLHDIAAQEGLVAIGYERQHGQYSRLHQFAKLYMFTGKSATYGCPLAMTDGAARLMELYGDEKLKAEAYKRLTTRDPRSFWTSGQWMTERPGGSDVGNTETIAELGPDGQWNISGFKWFSSATDSDVTMLLARVVDSQGNHTEGSKGLSLFFARVRDDEGKLNGIRVQRLKNKFGTKALPTAELELDNMKGQLVGELNRGVPTIATILNITRIYNAVTSCGGMRTAMEMAQDFARKRQTFGKSLDQHPLHLQTLASMEVEIRAATELSFNVVSILGKTECNQASKEEHILLRLLTPLVKLYTAKQSIAVASEAMECLGGMGYIEDTGMARILRDTQVGSIWEGTTNVLSLDVLRVLKAAPEALRIYSQAILDRLGKAKGLKGAEQSVEEIKKALHIIETYAKQSFQNGPLEEGARDFSYTLTRTYAASLLLEAYVASGSKPDAHSLEIWCSKGLVSKSRVFPHYLALSPEEAELALGKSRL